MKKVLVTGANGYLGSQICTLLLKKRFNVVGVCRKIPNQQALEGPLKGLEVLLGDLTDKTIISEIENLVVDSVVHTVSFDHKQSESFETDKVCQLNVQLNWQLMEMFSTKNISHFIYLSTIQVLGDISNLNVDEESQGIPLNKYGLTHLIGENMVQYYKKKTGLNYLSLRLSNGYGSPILNNSNWSWLVINDLCRMAVFEKKIVLQSNGEIYKDFIHLTDIAKSVSHLLLTEENLDPLYNMASGHSISLLSVAHTIKKVYELKFGIEIHVFHSRNILSKLDSFQESRYKIVNDNIVKTGFQFDVRLEEGINELLNYFLNLSTIPNA
ncbi:NAD-dependent epimerase/dehydratase family protein [Aquirufa nivalisilvae]